MAAGEDGATDSDGSTSTDEDAGSDVDGDPNAIPRVEAAACRFTAPVIDSVALQEGVDFACGDLVVYENRAAPAEGTIRLHFFRLNHPEFSGGSVS